MSLVKFAQSLSDLFRLSGSTRLDHVLLNRILAAIETRLRPLEDQKGALDLAIAQVRQLGLARINEILTPAIQSVLDIQGKGFLIARSSSDGLLGEGNILSLIVDDESERALFTPSPFTILSREATPDDYAIARTVAYDVETGEYLCEVMTYAGDEGPHTDWVIGALAGSTIAMLAYLDEAREARSTAVDKALATAADRVQTGLDRVATGQDRTQTGLDRLAAQQAAADAQAFDPAQFYTRATIDGQQGAQDDAIAAQGDALTAQAEAIGLKADAATTAASITAARRFSHAINLHLGA